MIRVTVLQSLREPVREVLTALGEIESSGYTDGSTTWTFIVDTERSAEEVCAAIFGRYPAIWCKATPAEPEPKPGLPVTMCYPNDCYPGTIVEVWPNLVRVQEDEPRGGGLVLPAAGRVRTFTRRKNGRYVEKGKSQNGVPYLHLGVREFYLCPEI